MFVGDAGVDLVESAQEVENEVGLRYRLPDVAQFVGLLLHANAVGVDGQVPLSHRVKLVIHWNTPPMAVQRALAVCVLSVMAG